MNRHRINYLDKLRIFATIGVITIHTCCQIIDSSVYEMPVVGSFNWTVAIIIDSLVRISVPIFLMISGTLFIGRNITIKELYSKYILRILIIYIIWSAFYALINGIFDPYSFFRSILTGGPRFNFLLYLIGLYMTTPILDKLCKYKNVMIYWLVVSLIVSAIIPLLNLIAGQSSIWWIKDINDIITTRIATMRLYPFMGFITYYILGYSLHNGWERKIDLWIYAGGIICIAGTICTTLYQSLNCGKTVFDYFDYNLPNCVLPAVALYIFFRNREKQEKRTYKYIGGVSDCTLGVYLVHTLILDTIIPKYLGINANSFNALLAIPLMVAFTFVISFLISLMLNNIPYINKYLV